MRIGASTKLSEAELKAKYNLGADDMVVGFDTALKTEEEVRAALKVYEKQLNEFKKQNEKEWGVTLYNRGVKLGRTVRTFYKMSDTQFAVAFNFYGLEKMVKNIMKIIKKHEAAAAEARAEKARAEKAVEAVESEKTLVEAVREEFGCPFETCWVEDETGYFELPVNLK